MIGISEQIKYVFTVFIDLCNTWNIVIFCLDLSTFKSVISLDKYIF